METEKTSANTTESKCLFENGECADCGAVTKPRSIVDRRGERQWYVASDQCAECGKKEDERLQYERKVDEIFRLGGLKARHEIMGLDNYKPTTENQRNILASLNEYSDGNIFIFGPVGTGKTHLISGLIRRIVEERLAWFKFRTGVDMLYEIRSTFNYGDPGETDRMIDKFTRTDILIIDDLGAEKSTEWARETFYMIIDRRYNMMKRTFITSNLSPKELANKLNDRLVSRLIEGAMILKIDGKDYRLASRNR